MLTEPKMAVCVLALVGAASAWAATVWASSPVAGAIPARIPAADRRSVSGLITYSTRSNDIWVVHADGSKRVQLTRSGAGEDFNPSFSPDGKQVVFRTTRGHYRPDPNGTGAEGIFVVNVRTKKLREIEPPTGGLFPAWSPNGRWIAFSGLRAGLKGDSVHLMTPTGSDVRDLGSEGAGECATWSPDSLKIAYCGHDGGGNWAVWVTNTDGTNKVKLTHPALAFPPGSGGDYPGAWSPDGKQIAYSSGKGKGRDLFVVNADGANPHRILAWPGADGPVAWLTDNKIVFGHFKGDEPLPGWYLVNPDGSRLKSLPWLKGAGEPLNWIQPR